MDILHDICMFSDPLVQTFSVKKFGNCATVLKDLIYKKNPKKHNDNKIREEHTNWVG